MLFRSRAVEKAAEKYEIQKEQKLARQSVVAGDDPVTNMREYFAENRFATLILDGLLEGETDPFGTALRDRFHILIR